LDDEELIAWQDVLDEIVAGRPGNAKCPFCGTIPMQVEPLAGEGMHGPVRISCTKCGKYIEGRFG